METSECDPVGWNVPTQQKLATSRNRGLRATGVPRRPRYETPTFGASSRIIGRSAARLISSSKGAGSFRCALLSFVATCNRRSGCRPPCD